jgi:hypothetical protein
VCHHRRRACCYHVATRRPAQVSNEAKCLERACSFDNLARLAYPRQHSSPGASLSLHLHQHKLKGRRRRQGSSRVAVARKGSSQDRSASKTPDLGLSVYNARVRLPPLCLNGRTWPGNACALLYPGRDCTGGITAVHVGGQSSSPVTVYADMAYASCLIYEQYYACVHSLSLFVPLGGSSICT